MTVVAQRYGTFDFDEPRFNIANVAFALARINRWCGHAEYPTSVAAHSLVVADLLKNEFGRPDLAFEGLMHDAHESVMHDITSQLKRDLPDYCDLENRIESAMRRQFGLPVFESPPVREVDMLSAYMEAALFLPHWYESGRFPDTGQRAAAARLSSKYLGVFLTHPASAEASFLDAFREMKP